MPVLNKDTDFPIVQLDNPADWRELAGCCGDFLSSPALDKLQTYLEPSAKGIIVERNYIDKDYRDTFVNFYSKKFANYPSRCVRLHFFRRALDVTDLWKLKDFESEYMGYVVARPTRVASIGRTLLDPAKIAGVRGTMCLTEYKINLLGSQLVVSAFPYMSQDTDVTVCAHAACWMMFRYFSERYPRYAEAWPFEITQMTKDFSHGRLVPSGGLTIGQITEICSEFGFFPKIYSRREFERLNPSDRTFFDRLLYQYVESGIPVIAALFHKEHALTVFGHLSDYTKVVPTGTLIDSYEYLMGFVVNDDNHMPYQIVARDRHVGPQHPEGFTINDIDAFVVPLYDKMHLFAEHIERWSNFILQHKHTGLAATNSSLKFEDVVMRIFLSNSNSYKRISRGSRTPPMPEQVRNFYLFKSMPHFIWVAEISDRSLYPNGQVLGEIIWDSTSNGWDRFSFCSIHYPELLIINDRHSLSENFDRLTIDRLSGQTPYEVYRRNLKEVP